MQEQVSGPARSPRPSLPRRMALLGPRDLGVDLAPIGFRQRQPSAARQRLRHSSRSRQTSSWRSPSIACFLGRQLVGLRPRFPDLAAMSLDFNPQAVGLAPRLDLDSEPRKSLLPDHSLLVDAIETRSAPSHSPRAASRARRCSLSSSWRTRSIRATSAAPTGVDPSLRPVDRGPLEVGPRHRIGRPTSHAHLVDVSAPRPRPPRGARRSESASRSRSRARPAIACRVASPSAPSEGGRFLG